VEVAPGKPDENRGEPHLQTLTLQGIENLIDQHLISNTTNTTNTTNEFPIGNFQYYQVESDENNFNQPSSQSRVPM
jgi:hypothetical protein